MVNFDCLSPPKPLPSLPTNPLTLPLGKETKTVYWKPHGEAGAPAGRAPGLWAAKLSVFQSDPKPSLSRDSQ